MWEYATEDPFAPTSYSRVEIAGDTTIGGRDYFVQQDESYDVDSVLTYSRRRFVRYEEEARTVVEFDTQRETDHAMELACDLAAPMYEGRTYLYTCPQVDSVVTTHRQVHVTAKYVDGHLRIGRDSIAYGARKMFCWGGPCDEYLHGIGDPGGFQEGGRAQSTLVYLRLGELEFGTSITVTASEEAPTGPRLGRPRLHITPNPTNGNAVIRAEATWAGSYELTIFDVSGRRVAQFNLDLAPGQPHRLGWSDLAPSLPAGVYFARLTDGRQASDVVSVVLVQ